jgi:ubiquinone/menaquinone biosynthesis C-methylase UbiE
MNANAEAIEAWNSVLYDKFTEYRDLLVTALSIHGTRAIVRHAPRPGARVVDLGCGFGDTALELARAIGPFGRVVGLDAAERFIVKAREEAAAHANVSFEVADIQASVPGGPYDFAFSRMGMMFFTSPVIALRNVRKALAPGGKLCMVVWRSKAANACVDLPEQAVLRLLGRPDKGDNVTCGPGPFSMASADVVGDQLVAAGFTDIAFERSDANIDIGDDLDAAMRFALSLGPAGEIVRLAGDEAVRRRTEIEAAVRESMASFVTPTGISGPTSTWIVTARAASQSS